MIGFIVRIQILTISVRIQKSNMRQVNIVATTIEWIFDVLWIGEGGMKSN